MKGRNSSSRNCLSIKTMGKNYHLKKREHDYPLCYTKEDWSEKEGHETINIDLKPLRSVEAKVGSLDLAVKGKLFVLNTDKTSEQLIL